MEYMSWGMVLALFLGLGAILGWMGVRSLAGLGPVRRWVAVGVRLAVLLLLLLILGGLRYERQNESVEVMVLRDVSGSTGNVRPADGRPLEAAVNDYLQVAATDPNKQRDDRVGLISFGTQAQVDAMPNIKLELGSHAIRNLGSGTDVSSAIHLALATMGREARHRLVLMWDGNQTTGDLETAVAAAAAQHVPIDVMPLHYDVNNEVLMDKFVAPTWKRQNEPFTIDVFLKSTNAATVTGKLTVLHQGTPIELEAGKAWRMVTLQPGVNRFSVSVPALQQAGVHQFKAIFEGENVSASVGQPGAPKQGDTIAENNSADAFTFVRGQGQVLYVDNVKDGRGELLANKLKEEGINVQRVGVDKFPADVMTLQNYDAVILANVPHGYGGLNDGQQAMLASYVHDMGGGVVMIGGEQSFGAGGWQGTKLEEILPVNMDIPGQRQINKGALVLIMHSCEMPEGNYWGEQCALKAVETLSAADEVGVITFGWGTGGSQWEYALQPKGDGSQVNAAIKKMQVGDMPSFDDSMKLALHGKPGQLGLKDSDARQKHVIIVSDGDPSAPNPGLVKEYLDANVSVSTISVYPHNGPGTMIYIAKSLNGRHYGPIESNPNQLPQIFIKEAVVVRRSLICEEPKGLALSLVPSASEMVKGLGSPPPVYGMVLTTRKPNPQIEVPLVAGKMNDPILAHWQSGLGKAAAYTSDAHAKWGANWVASASFGKFWAQVVRGVSRPPMSSDFDVKTVLNGDKGKIVVEAMGKDSAFVNFLNIRGQVVGPDMKGKDVRLVQTGPGTYQADFDASDAGNYVVVLNYKSARGEGGVLLSGVAMNSTPELRDLHSNEAVLQSVADRTGGRMLPPFEGASADLFNRKGLVMSASPQPIWDILIPLLLGLFLVDVATRRIAWDWLAIRKAVSGRIEAFTRTRKVETRQSLDALKRVREEQAEAKSKVVEKAPEPFAPAAPDPTAKFQAKGVEGDITQVVGGATDKPVPSAPKKIEPKGGVRQAGDHTGGLLEAKRRAQQKIKEKENEK